MTIPFEIPPWDIVDLLWLLLLAGAGVLSIMSLGAGHEAKVAKRSAYEHLGRHCARFALWLGLAGYLMAVVSQYAFTQALPEGMKQPDPSMYYNLAGLGLTVFWLVLRFAKVPWRVFAIGSVLTVWIIFPLWKANLFGTYLLEGTENFTTMQILLAQLTEGARAMPEMLAVNMALFVFCGLTVGGGLILVYLLARRKGDDYGRDYYRMAVNRCASRAAVGGLLLAVSLGAGVGFVLYHEGVANPKAAALWIGLMEGSLLLASSFWLAIARNETPMRFKSLMVAGVFLLMVFCVGLAGTLGLSPRFMELL